MKLLSFMILPNLLFFVILPRLLVPVKSLNCLFVKHSMRIKTYYDMIFTSANKNSVFTCKLWQFHKMLFQRKLLSLPKYLVIFVVLITIMILKFVYIGFVDRSHESFQLDICGCTRTIPPSKSNILWGNIFRKEELKSTCSRDADRRGPNQKAKKLFFE